LAVSVWLLDAAKAHTGAPAGSSLDTFVLHSASVWVNEKICGQCHKERVYAQYRSIMQTEAGKIQGAIWGRIPPFLPICAPIASAAAQGSKAATSAVIFAGWVVGACHIPYNNAGLYEGGDHTVKRDEKGHSIQSTRKTRAASNRRPSLADVRTAVPGDAR
jgi:hypothetical protein